MPLAHTARAQSAMVLIADDETQGTQLAARSVPGGYDADPSAGPPDPDSDARIGQAMHRLLEWLALSPGAARSSPHGVAQPADPGLGAGSMRCAHWSDRQLAAAALGFDLDARQITQATHMARAVREGDAAWVWDSEVITWCANEVPLTFGGQSLRIDRLVRRRDTGAWWVLDYKSAADPLDRPELRDQLAVYLRAVAALYPGDVVHAAFLTAQGRLIEAP
jgi:ATP-dependent helicase/nuclease subunit A